MNDISMRGLPAVNRVLASERLQNVNASRPDLVRAVREAIDEARAALQTGLKPDLGADRIAERALERLVQDRFRLRPVINASGILLHTGLGRAPLARDALEAIVEVAQGYCDLEFRLETGDRGQRGEGIADLLRRLTGAEDGLVVNNNAAATVLALRALAKDREAIVSRGQLVEIGGSFRLPEIFEVSGAKLREVGTTNRTRLADYEKAIGPDTAALLRVHSSNYRIVGFTESVGIRSLAELGKARGLWTIDDVGSGLLQPNALPGIVDEPSVEEGIRAGADLVLFSGDKLLGGPQAGLLAGSKAAVGKLRSDPLMRAFRVDKLTIAALDATLRLALDPKLAKRRIPLWSFLTADLQTVRERSLRLADALLSQGWNADAIETEALLGGGSVPVEPIPSFAARISPPWPKGCVNVDALARSLRIAEPAIVPRVQEGALLLDLRAVDQAQDALIEHRLASLHLAGASSSDVP